MGLDLFSAAHGPGGHPTHFGHVSVSADSFSRDQRLPTVIAGTRNLAKVGELARLVEGVARLLPPPHDISQNRDVGGDETGETVEAVAVAKAVAWSQRLSAAGSGHLVIASDGGLLVPGLGNGWDPTRTRRFSLPATNAREHADALIALTEQLEGDQRRIGWREAVAFAREGKLLGSFVAESVAGVLARDYDPALVMTNGFWVPALWICPEFGGRRLAELAPEERTRRDDHWSRLRRQVQQNVAELMRQ